MSENQEYTGEMSEATAPVEANEMPTQEGYEQQERQDVPLDALKAERAERQRLQDELRMIKDNMSLLMSQQQQSYQKPQEDEYGNVSDDDVLTFGDFKKALQKEKKQYEMTLNELRMTQKYPDYQEVVTKFLPDVIKQNPNLRRSLEQTQDFELAYTLAKNSEAYRSQNKKQRKNADAERVLENAQRPGNLSSVGQTSPISQAKNYKQMSDAEFMQMANRNRGYF